jgi:hypothetical protein
MPSAWIGFPFIRREGGPTGAISPKGNRQRSDFGLYWIMPDVRIQQTNTGRVQAECYRYVLMRCRLKLHVWPLRGQGQPRVTVETKPDYWAATLKMTARVARVAAFARSVRRESRQVYAPFEARLGQTGKAVQTMEDE